MRNIRFYRLLKGLSQEELAELVGISQPKISLLEKGIIKVSGTTLEDIAEQIDFPLPVGKLLDFIKK